MMSFNFNNYKPRGITSNTTLNSETGYFENVVKARREILEISTLKTDILKMQFRHPERFLKSQLYKRIF